MSMPNMEELNDNINEVFIKHGIFEEKYPLTIELGEEYSQSSADHVLCEVRILYYRPLYYRDRLPKKHPSLISANNPKIEKRPRFKYEPLTATLPAAQHLEAAFAEAAEAMNNFKKALIEAKNVLDSLTNEAEK